MAGNKQGGLKAAQKNKEKHGDDFYSRLGTMGQQAYLAQPKHLRKPRGFAAMSREKVAAAGRKGGTISRRDSNE